MKNPGHNHSLERIGEQLVIWRALPVEIAVLIQPTVPSARLTLS
jgi:hypothetical protein